MWFKNARVYKVTEAVDLDAIEEKLKEMVFTPCASLDREKYGFYPPLGKSFPDSLIHKTNEFVMVCSKHQEKIIPAAAVNEALQNKVDELSVAESRHVGRKERQTMKDEIIFSMLPTALKKSSYVYAYFDPKENLFIVDTPSARKAEDIISKIREALGSLKLIPLSAKNIPTQTMTHWIQNDVSPHQFELGDECELTETKDERTIKCKRQDLSADEVKNHLTSGLFVSKIALTWKESIHFVVDSQLAVKKIKFDDLICDKANDRNPESKAEQFDADFSIMSGELRAMFQALIAAFGGQAEDNV